MAIDFYASQYNNIPYGNYGGWADQLNNGSSDYGNYGNRASLSGDGRTDADRAAAINEDEVKKPGRRSSPEECETCKNRKYQDGSDEANVSFKNAAHISPEAAGAAVRAHENQHVQNAYKKAAEKNAEVVSASVAIHTAVCPECGRSYVSGGVTQTMIRYTNDSNPYQQRQKTLDRAQYAGANLDAAV